MKEIKSIELVLENLEAVKINREHIGHFLLKDITRSISRNAMNSVSETYAAKELYLEVSSAANTINSFEATWGDGGQLPFERLNHHPDIASVVANYIDGSSEDVYVPWGVGEFDNEYQTSAINPYTGDLYIVVSEKEKAASFYDDELSSEDSSKWELYKED